MMVILKRLKKKILLGITLVIIGTLCGCLGARIDRDEAAKQLANQVFEYLNNEDAEGLKSLFSRSISESHDLDKEIEELFEFFDGKIISYDDFSSGSGSETVEDGKQTFVTISPVIRNVKTDTGKVYVIRFFSCLVYTEDEDEVGIVGLKIIVDDENEYLVGDW